MRDAGISGIFREIGKPSSKTSLKEDLALLGKAIPYARLVLKHHLAILGLTTLLSLTGLVLPFIPKIIIDKAIPLKDTGLATGMMLIGFGIQLAGIFTGWFASVYRNQVSGFVRFLTTREALASLSLSSPKQTSMLRTGDIISRLGGMESGVSFLFGSLETVVRSMIQLLALPAIMLAMDWRILLFGIPSVAVSIILWITAQNSIRNLNRKSVEASARTSSSLYDVVQSLQELQISNLSKKAVNEYSKEYGKSWKISAISESFSSLVSSVQSQISSIALLALQIYGWNLVIDSEWTVGMMTTIVFALNMIRQPVMELLSLRQSAMNTAIQISRYQEICQIQALRDSGDEPPPAVPGCISLDKATFSYNGTDKILDELSATFLPKSISVVIGNSGCGKTTLLKILGGLLEPDSGMVAIDGKSYECYDMSRWRSSISSISQNPYFIPGSLQANLRFGTVADSSKVAEVVRICRLEDAFRRFGSGSVGEGGRILSSGERQRVAYARALLQDRPVFILDEPLSQVDMATTRGIIHDSIAILKSKTCIMATHNPLWMECANNVFAMYGGKLFLERA